MPGGCVIDRNPGRGRQSRTQNLRILGCKPLGALGQKPDHLSFGDDNTYAGQQRRQPVRRDLSQEVQRQDEALEVWSEPARYARRQRAAHSLSRRRCPAFTTIPRGARPQIQILHDNVVVAFEPRSCRRLSRQHHLLGDRDPRQSRATPTPGALLLLGTKLRLGRALHPRGFVRRPARQLFQARDLVLECSVFHRERRHLLAKPGVFVLERRDPLFQPGHLGANRAQFLNQPNKYAAKIIRGQTSKRISGQALHWRVESRQSSARQSLRPGICPTYKVTLPSAEEQKKIAAFLSAVDSKLEALRRKRLALKRYKAGLMQRLFSKTLRFTRPDGTAFPDWKEKTLGSFAEFSKGKGVSKTDISPTGATPCVRYGELYTEYEEVIENVVSRTIEPVEDLLLSIENDVLIPASGESALDIAKASCIKLSGVALGGDINVIRGVFVGPFLAYYINHMKRLEIARLAQGNSVVHLYGHQLKKLTVDLPHPDEQRKIADTLAAIDAKIHAVVSQILKMEAFKKSLLQKMFV